MRVLVLGGTGFVGPFVVEQLVDRSHEVTLFHRGRTEPQHVAGAHHVHGEFQDLRSHVAALVAREPDVIVDISPGIGKAGHGVLHFAGLAARGVVLTSMDVYRAMSILWGAADATAPQAMPVTEDSELRRRRSPDFGAGLAFDNLEVEEAVAAAPFPVTILRCPVIYGPLDSQRRLREYVRRMADKRPAIVLDARLAGLRLSRGYVENVAAAVVATVSDERAAGRVYNVAEPEALTEAEWVRSIGEVFGWPGEVVVADPDRLPESLKVAVPAQDLYGDSSRIRKELGYSEPVTRAEGLRRSIDWELARQRDEPGPSYEDEDAALTTMR